VPLSRIVDAAMEATVVPSFTRIGPAVRSRLEGWTDLDDLDLTGRVVVVTGANSGLGYAIAEQVARLGASLRITVRDDEKGTTTVARLVEATGNHDISYGLLDVAHQDSVRAYARSFLAAHDRLDGLVHNAGAMFSQRREVDGVETTVAVHVVGPLLLTHELLPALRASDHPARVVWMSSGGMYSEGLDVARLESPDDYKPATAYARAKRAQVVLAEELAARLDEVVVHSMHPGWAATPGVERSLPVFNRVLGPLLRDPAQGAETATWLVASPEGAGRSGSFWLDRRPRSSERVPGTRTTPDQRTRLWRTVTGLAGLTETAFGERRSPA